MVTILPPSFFLLVPQGPSLIIGSILGNLKVIAIGNKWHKQAGFLHKSYQVVPHFGGVTIQTSSSKTSKFRITSMSCLVGKFNIWFLTWQSSFVQSLSGWCYNLLWWFDCTLKPIFDTAPSCLKKWVSLQKWSKVT